MAIDKPTLFRHPEHAATGSPRTTNLETFSREFQEAYCSFLSTKTTPHNNSSDGGSRELECASIPCQSTIGPKAQPDSTGATETDG
ncbi:Hypothetical protein NTJ_09756 [Nesidiocoris tenuis]|uniref:Uncharacterized protein n=1 Tax=Nesidiocoris tenuis TaxID=355587 RepID=A0ABN7AXQ0_9HEMI|nr:Hypothetical protein NTJ_09756 [Nesidiocoris tenuis]